MIYLKFLYVGFLLVIFSCHGVPTKDIEVLKWEEIEDFKPKDCLVLDKENYVQGHRYYVVKNNTSDTLKFRNYFNRVLEPVTEKIRYSKDEDLIEYNLPRGLVKHKPTPKFEYFLLPLSIDTVYTCGTKPKRLYDLYYEVEYLKKDDLRSVYLD